MSKGSSSEAEVTFSLKFTTLCICKVHTPEICLGTIGAAGALVSGGLSTAQAFPKFALACGSEQSGLNDFIFNFQVAQSGIYRFSTINVTGSNTTLQINDCNGNFFACNVGDIDVGTTLQVYLPSDTNLFGTVSKFNSNSSEVSATM